MAQRIQGMEDLLGASMCAWQTVIERSRALFETYGFEMIETPALEQLSTFVHGIGESSDVVRKEMFRSFSGALLEKLLAEGSEASLKPRQRMALRPEGTAGVARAVVEHNLAAQGAAPAKLWYAGPMFRGERPQKGRLRQFHQVGVEYFGTPSPVADAEVIIMFVELLERLGFVRSELKLRINSMGDEACRPAYRERVRAFILDHASEMCDDCLERAELNPLRCFDCKNAHCQTIMADAPRVDVALCDECQSHYQTLKDYLSLAGIDYEEDCRLVRGLDYYTRTVFEVDVCGAEDLGAIGGGGRYDGLVELSGGKATPAVGFALGFERTVLALEALGKPLAQKSNPCAYVACADPGLAKEAFLTALELRRAGIRTELDTQGRSLKSQFKQADKLGAALCIIVGADEHAQGAVTLRDMESHEQELVSYEDLLARVSQKL